MSKNVEENNGREKKTATNQIVSQNRKSKREIIRLCKNADDLLLPMSRTSDKQITLIAKNNQFGVKCVHMTAPSLWKCDT